jgi:hypothetical protein
MPRPKTAAAAPASKKGGKGAADQTPPSQSPEQQQDAQQDAQDAAAEDALTGTCAICGDGVSLLEGDDLVRFRCTLCGWSLHHCSCADKFRRHYQTSYRFSKVRGRRRRAAPLSLALSLRPPLTALPPFFLWKHATVVRVPEREVEERRN